MEEKLNNGAELEKALRDFLAEAYKNWRGESWKVAVQENVRKWRKYEFLGRHLEFEQLDCLVEISVRKGDDKYHFESYRVEFGKDTPWKDFDEFEKSPWDEWFRKRDGFIRNLEGPRTTAGKLEEFLPKEDDFNEESRRLGFSEEALDELEGKYRHKDFFKRALKVGNSFLVLDMSGIMFHDGSASPFLKSQEGFRYKKGGLEKEIVKATRKRFNVTPGWGGGMKALLSNMPEWLRMGLVESKG